MSASPSPAPTAFVVGEALLDRVRAPGGVVEVPGGAPFNVARGLARLGMATAFLGAVGEDHVGDILVAALEEAGVDVSFVQRVSLPTAVVEVTVDPDGPGYRFLARDSAERHWRRPAVPFARASNLLYVGSNTLALDPAGEEAERLVLDAPEAVTVAFDPNVRPAIIPDEGAYRRRVAAVLDRAAIVKLSTEDLAYLAPDQSAAAFAHERIAAGTSLVVVTAAADGASGFTASASVTVGARTVRVVDAVGAGDSAMAGLLWALSARALLSAEHLGALSSEELRAVLEVAMDCAALSLAHSGAYAPRRDELVSAR